ncbi:MAG: response regulator [Candidatus Hydrogenedentes bacterium]|nr:response regulator [Candidatus Hydrogenedentota bacterium]
MQTTNELERSQIDASPAKKRKILFVDDDPNFLDGIRRMLRGQRDNWSMEFVNGVEEALQRCSETEFDTVVSDVNMPGKTGLDLLQALRGDERTRAIPIIILTGNAETDLKRQALDLGATDLLNKPVGHEDLVARLRSVLRLKAYQDELRDQNAYLEQRVKERTAELENARRDIIWRLAKAGEFRDEETGEHVIRVACCCRVLALALELPDEEIQNIFLTSPLHDVGKIGIPDRILLKPGILDESERLIMEEHCKIGASILMAQPKGIVAFLDSFDETSLEPAVEADRLRELATTIIMTHHEKWDGTGYPQGLKGDEIPIVGQICAVADVYDALRSKRPYKESYCVEETMEQMRADCGSHFSPRIFSAFESIADEFEKIRKQFTC